jgi:endogenous inhibitor of DNA gyrase (YacG/DUF329 family)
MSIAVARVVVACPTCQQQFEDWWRPMLDPSVHVSAAMLDESLPTTCPNCLAPIDWDRLDDHDGVFST